MQCQKQNEEEDISTLCYSLGVSFLGIQEPRLQSNDLFIFRSIWENFNFDFASNVSLGRSGGIVSLWDPSVFMKVKVGSNENVLIVQGKWVDINHNCYMVNVYAQHDNRSKRELWLYLHDYIQSNKGSYFFW